jgi:hypothetical protein
MEASPTQKQRVWGMHLATPRHRTGPHLTIDLEAAAPADQSGESLFLSLSVIARADDHIEDITAAWYIIVCVCRFNRSFVPCP